MTRPSWRPIPDGGPGMMAHFPPGPGTVIVRCAAAACSSALAMPPDTDEQGQARRLAAAGWRPVDGFGLMCPDAHGRTPAPVPVTPGWAFWTVAVGLYLLLAVAATVVIDMLGGPTLVYALTLPLLTLAWWVHVARRWQARR